MLLKNAHRLIIQVHFLNCLSTWESHWAKACLIFHRVTNRAHPDRLPFKNDHLQLWSNHICSSVNNKTNLRGHKLTSNVLAPVGLIAQARPLGNCKLSPNSDQCLFSIPPPCTETACGHQGSAPNPYLSVSVFTANETFRQKGGWHRLACGYTFLSDIS